MTGKLKLHVYRKFWKLSQQMKEKKEKTLRLARGGKDMSNKKGRFVLIHGPRVYSGNIDERSDGAGRGV